MKIRKEQLAAFPKAVEENLECRLYRHVRNAWPGRCERMGEETVRQWIREGIRRARQYGVEADYDVSRYIDLMFLLGRDFGRDSQTPWAREILSDDGLEPAEKLDRLFARVEEHLRARRHGGAG